MRGALTFAATIAIGALVATIFGRWTDGYWPGVIVGAAYMIGAALVVNSREARS